MEVYTNSKTIKELITSQTDIEVEPFNQFVPDSKEVDVFLLDDHLLQLQLDYQEDDAVCLHETTLLWRRPEWSGGINHLVSINNILEMMKFNERVRYRAEYNPDSHYLKFKPCDTPNLVAGHCCILPQFCLLLPEEKQAIQALLQPVIFGAQLAGRMMEANVITNPDSVTQARGDYEKLCLNLNYNWAHKTLD